MNNTRLVDPGKFRIGALELSSDFHPDLELLMGSLAIELNIFESVYEDCVSGNIILNDSRNILSKLPIVGYETVKVIYYIDEERLDGSINSIEYSKKFKIHSITDYKKENATTSMYSVNFISEEYFTDLTVKVSKSYRNTSISNIANLVFSELNSTKKINIDPTIVSQDLVIPNWTPFSAMNWLANRAISGSYKGANYLFYENKDGYNFVSLEGLFERGIEQGKLNNIPEYRQPIRDFVFEPEARKLSFYNVLDISYDTGINITDNISNGMYASKVIEHDIVKRTFKINEFNYEKTFDSYEHMNKGSLDDNRANGNSYSGKNDAKIMYVPKHTKKYDNSYDYSDNIQNSIQIRQSQMQQMKNFSVSFIVAGDTTRTVGDIVELKIVSPEPVGERDIWDPVYSGKYLIINLKHTIDVSKYLTTITAVKDSYKDPIPKTTLRQESDTGFPQPNLL